MHYSGISRLKRVKYEDFPLKLYYRLLSKEGKVPERFLGTRKWNELTKKWEEEDRSLEADRMLEDQKRAALPLLKAQKASIALKWVMQNSEERQALLEEVSLPYRKDIKEQVTALSRYIEKHYAQYQNNLLQLEVTQKQQNSTKNSTFTIEDAIATLDLGGFTVTDPNKLTIGQFKAMNRAIQKNGKRQN